MLVLSRRVSEAIVIGDRVLIRVGSVHGKRVRLLIDAPEGVTVHREEIQQKRIQYELPSEPESVVVGELINGHHLWIDR